MRDLTDISHHVSVDEVQDLCEPEVLQMICILACAVARAGGRAPDKTLDFFV